MLRDQTGWSEKTRRDAYDHASDVTNGVARHSGRGGRGGRRRGARRRRRKRKRKRGKGGKGTTRMIRGKKTEGRAGEARRLKRTGERSKGGLEHGSESGRRGCSKGPDIFDRDGN